MTSRFRKAVISLWPYALVIFVYAAFRLVELDRFVHIDEPHWLGRSMNFYRALASGELQHTYQREHPGVLTMWAGALAWLVRFPEVATLLEGNVANPYNVSRLLWSWGQDPLDLMTAARVSKVLLQSVFFALSIVFLRGLVGRAPALLIGALIALSPTMIGWDSWIHIDGMAAITAFSGLTATAYAAERTDLSAPRNMNSSVLWILAGAISSTTWLTRISGLSIIGVMGLALLFHVVILVREGSPMRAVILSAIRYGLLWVVGAVLGTFALLPALWVNPVEIIKEVVWLPVSGVLGRGDPAFFPAPGGSHDDRGLMYLIDEVRVRTTPFEWLGIILFVFLAYYAWRRNLISGSWLRLFSLAACFAAVNILGLAASPKTYTRYLMIVYPLLTLMAGLGLATGLKLIRAKMQTPSKVIVPATTAIVLGYSLIASTMLLPYKMLYANPIEMAITGRGPGSVLRPGQDLVGAYINDTIGDSAEGLPVVFHPGGIRYALEYFVSSEDSGVRYRVLDISSPEGWYETDYALIPGSPSADVFEFIDPLYEVTVGDSVVYRIYGMNEQPPPDQVLSPNACSTTFGESAELLQIVASEQRINLYFRSFDPQPFVVEATVSLSEGETHEIYGQSDTVPPGEIIKVTLRRPDDVPADIFTPSEVTIRATTDSEITLPVSGRWSDADEDAATIPIDCYSMPHTTHELSPRTP